MEILVNVLEIKNLGFTTKDTDEILRRFSCRLGLEDWESMKLYENDEAIFKYLFIEGEDKESIAESFLEISRINVSDLDEGQSLMEYMIEEDESRLKLSDGKWVVFPEDLLRKDIIAQMD